MSVPKMSGLANHTRIIYIFQYLFNQTSYIQNSWNKYVKKSDLIMRITQHIDHTKSVELAGWN